MAFLDKGLGLSALPSKLDVMTALVVIDSFGTKNLEASTKAALALSLLQTTDEKILKKAIRHIECRYGLTVNDVMKYANVKATYVWTTLLPNAKLSELIFPWSKWNSFECYNDRMETLITLLNQEKDILAETFANAHNTLIFYVKPEKLEPQAWAILDKIVMAQQLVIDPNANSGIGKALIEWKASQTETAKANVQVSDITESDIKKRLDKFTEDYIYILTGRKV
jgi:hypothetical protein